MAMAPERHTAEEILGKLRDEMLKREIFHAHQGWREEYNHRPPSPLGYEPPAPEAIQGAVRLT